MAWVKAEANRKLEFRFKIRVLTRRSVSQSRGRISKWKIKIERGGVVEDEKRRRRRKKRGGETGVRKQEKLKEGRVREVETEEEQNAEEEEEEEGEEQNRR